MSSAQDPTGARDEPRLFSPATRAWFRAAFPAGATPAQTEAWDAISREESTLVVAPTGSGKTLAAFLWGLDDLARRPAPEDRGRRCRLLYVSPLKALATDIEKNLRAPLSGIRRAARERGAAVPDITVGVRTGDTPASQRRALAAKPPDVLITTPESLFLVLTSRARSSLAGVETVIVDEVHSLAGTKRGAHLALSLERLDALLDRSAQRIGLSATVRPAEEVAYFLGGASPAEGDDEGRPRPVTVVAPPHAPNLDLSIAVPGGGHDGAGRGCLPLARRRHRGQGPHVDLAARRGADSRAGHGAPFVDCVLQFPPGGRTVVRAAERARYRAGSRTASGAARG